MNMEIVNISLPKPVAEAYSKEARRRTREKSKFISRAAVMRDILTENVEAACLQCQPTQSVKTP